MSEITFTIKELFLFLIGLIVLFSPFGIIPTFGGYISAYPVKIQRRIARRVSIYAFGVLAVSGFAGELILRTLGISLSALTLTGGFILLLSSIPMVMRGHVAREESLEVKDRDEGWKAMLVVPLTFPLAVGAAQISYVITYFSQSNGFADRLVLAGMLMIAWLVIWLSLFLSGPMARKLSHSGNDILIRISGIILMSLAFMLLSQGVTGLLNNVGV